MLTSEERKERRRTSSREWARRNADKNKKYREEHPEEMHKYRRKYIEKNRENINKRFKERYANDEERRAYYRKWNKERNLKSRWELVQKFGGKCVRCGYSEDYRALHIDHKNGGGGKHRKTFKSMYSYTKYLLEYEGDEFQILCANCNWIKRYDDNELDL